MNFLQKQNFMRLLLLQWQPYGDIMTAYYDAMPDWEVSVYQPWTVAVAKE